MPAPLATEPSDVPTAVLVAVPDDAVADLVAAGLASEFPGLRGPVLDVVVAVGVDSASVVTLMQAPDTVRAFAAWLVDRVGRRRSTLSVVCRRPGTSLRLEVDGEVPVDAVTDFLLAVFSTAED